MNFIFNLFAYRIKIQVDKQVYITLYKLRFFKYFLAYFSVIDYAELEKYKRLLERIFKILRGVLRNHLDEFKIKMARQVRHYILF